MENSIVSLIHRYSENILAYDNVFKQIDTDLGSSINFSEYPSVIIYLSIYEQYCNKDETTNIHRYISCLIDNLKKIGKCDSSLCYGITGVAYALKFASSKGERYKTLSENVDNLFIKITRESLLSTKESLRHNKIKESDYDIIQGLSSNLVYLLSADRNDPAKDLIIELINFFIELMKFPNKWEPNYLIREENMVNKELKSEFKKGYINLSVSHGIASPLLALSLAYKRGYRVSGLKKTIENSLYLYRKIAIEKVEKINTIQTKKIFWSGRMSAKEICTSTQVNNKDIIETKRSSWCYGTPGIARVLYICSKIVGDKKTEIFALDALKGICHMSLQELMLESPTVCHGLAGVLMVIDSMYKETKDVIFYNYSIKLINWILQHKHLEYNFIFYNYDYKDPNDKSIGQDKIEDLSILSGSTGVVLSLMSTTLEKDMYWKRMFLI